MSSAIFTDDVLNAIQRLSLKWSRWRRQRRVKAGREYYDWQPHKCSNCGCPQPPPNTRTG